MVFFLHAHNRVSSGFQLAEKYFVKGGDPRAAIEMYTKANMYEAAHKVTKFSDIFLIGPRDF